MVLLPTHPHQTRDEKHTGYHIFPHEVTCAAAVHNVLQQLICTAMSKVRVHKGFKIGFTKLFLQPTLLSSYWKGKIMIRQHFMSNTTNYSLACCLMMELIRKLYWQSIAHYFLPMKWSLKFTRVIWKWEILRQLLNNVWKQKKLFPSHQVPRS